MQAPWNRTTSNPSAGDADCQDPKNAKSELRLEVPSWMQETFQIPPSFGRNTSNWSVNLPFLVQMMQPGLGLEAAEEEQGRRVSNYSHKTSLSRRSRQSGIAISTGHQQHSSQSNYSRTGTDNDNNMLEDDQYSLLFKGNIDPKPDPKPNLLLERPLTVTRNKSNTDTFLDNLIAHAAQFEAVLEEIDKGPTIGSPVEDNGNQDDIEGSPDDEKKSKIKTNSSQYASEQSTLLKRSDPWQRRNKPTRIWSRSHKSWYRRFYANYLFFCKVLRPSEIQINFKEFVTGVFLLQMVPLLCLAWLLFYVLGNPGLVFLSDNAKLSWYVLQVLRWLVTLTLARMTQYCLVLVTRRTSIMARFAGPFVTLMAMQSIGWPFLCFSWGCWNLLLLHGKNPFSQNWLYFSGIALFSPVENPDGDNILACDLYGRILVAMISVGFVCGLKSTLTALFLSRRMLLYYRPQLKETMFQMKLVTGIAELAAETLKPGFNDVVADALAKAEEVQIERMTAYMDAIPTFTTPQIPTTEGFLNSEEELKPFSDREGRQSSYTEIPDNISDSSYGEGWERFQRISDPFDLHSASRSGGTYAHVIAGLPSWVPPVDKSSKNQEPAGTLHDIVQLRRALSFMEGLYPFSQAYGLCDCRENCIRSALRVYERLLNFIPHDKEPTLMYDVIGALAYASNGHWSEKRALGLMSLFTPNKDFRLSRNEFVQACDNVYKKMVFLRASMNNSSKIDSVLEEMFDWVFYGILCVVVLSQLRLNIWPLLVSLSTVLLSFTFAFSATCARIVEGMMLIAVRRPFDIGDRITISKVENFACPGAEDAWRVEDIDLTTTTLRYLATSEVCTIDNSTLTTQRIVNLNRSPKACITLLVRFTLDSTHTQVECFRRRLQKYLEDRPRSWEALVYFRNFDLQKLEGYVTYKLQVRHTQPWQNPTVMAHKAKLELQLDKIASELKIGHWTNPNTLNVKMH